MDSSDVRVPSNSTNPLAAFDVAELFASHKPHPSAVTLESDYKKWFFIPAWTKGAGFMVQSKNSDDCLIATNDHNLEKSDTPKVTTADGTVFQSTTVLRDPGHDLALLKLDGVRKTDSVCKPVSFAEKAPQVGDREFAFGSAQDRNDQISVSGTFAEELSRKRVRVDGRNFDNDAMFHRSLIATLPGYSGGPDFDIDGLVVAVNESGTASRNLGFGIPSRFVQQDLDKLPMQTRRVSER